MLQSVLVYLMLFVLMSFCGTIAANRQWHSLRLNKMQPSFLSIEILIIILVFSVVFGCRWNVGVDYPAYYHGYVFGATGEYEPLFSLLQNTLTNIGAHYAVFFSIIAFVEILCLLYAFRNYRFLFPLIFFVLIFGTYYLSMMNIMRQQLAACIFLCSIRYIVDKKPYQYYILVFIAFLFHKSAVLLVAVYPLVRIFEKIKLSKTIQLVILFIAFILSFKYELVANSLVKPFELFVQLLGYDVYAAGILFNDTLNNANQFGNNSGLGVYVNLFMAGIVILYSDKLKCYYNDKWYSLMYVFWFIRVISQFVVGQSIVLNRPFVYFTNIPIFIYASLIWYLWNTKKALPQFISVFFILIYVVLFFNMMSNGEVNTTKFTFFWQNNFL